MAFTTHTQNDIIILFCPDCSEQLHTERDALDWLSACFEHGADCVLIDDCNLSEDFYHLSSGAAGAILQKFNNYQMRVAAVLPPEKSSRGKFGEMVLETNRGSEFRVFDERASAENWLSSFPKRLSA